MEQNRLGSDPFATAMDASVCLVQDRGVNMEMVTQCYVLMGLFGQTSKQRRRIIELCKKKKKCSGWCACIRDMNVVQLWAVLS